MKFQARIMRSQVPFYQHRRKISAVVLAVSIAASLLVSMDAAWAQSFTPGAAKVAKPITELAPSFGGSTIRNVGAAVKGNVADVTKNAKAGQNQARYEAFDEIRTAAILPRVTPGNLMPSKAIHDGSVLGTVPIRVGGLAVSPRWQAILAAGPARLFTAECSALLGLCNSSLRRAFDRLAPAAEGAPALDMVRTVDRLVNRLIRYQVDVATFGVDDYWATPEETAARGVGDCEDFVIVKFGMLLALGVPADSMRVLVVKDLVRNIGHALLSVEIQGETYILDSNTDAVRLEAETDGFQPLYSIGANGAWIHGIRRAPVYQVATTSERAAQ